MALTIQILAMMQIAAQKRALEQLLESAQSEKFTTGFEVFSAATKRQVMSTGNPPPTTAELHEEWKKLTRGRRKDWEDLVEIITQEKMNRSRFQSSIENAKKQKRQEPEQPVQEAAPPVEVEIPVCIAQSTPTREMEEAKEARSLRKEIERHACLVSRMGTFDTEFMSGYPTLKTPMLHF